MLVVKVSEALFTALGTWQAISKPVLAPPAVPGTVLHLVQPPAAVSALATGRR